jgi:hypothetical protein
MEAESSHHTINQNRTYMTSHLVPHPIKRQENIQIVSNSILHVQRHISVNNDYEFTYPNGIHHVS